MSGYTYDTDFMRKAVGFVPARSVNMKWVDEDAQAFDTWLARIKRDAAREALDALAAAEHRATRAEAQSAIRGRAVAIYRERARQAEAERDEWRQTALETVAADIWDQGYRAGFSDGPFICACNAWSESECACGNYGNGETPDPNPYRASETA